MPNLLFTLPTLVKSSFCSKTVTYTFPVLSMYTMFLHYSLFTLIWWNVLPSPSLIPSSLLSDLSCWMAEIRWLFVTWEGNQSSDDLKAHLSKPRILSKQNKVLYVEVSDFLGSRFTRSCHVYGLHSITVSLPLVWIWTLPKRRVGHVVPCQHFKRRNSEALSLTQIGDLEEALQNDNPH